MAALIHSLDVSSISGCLHCETFGMIVTISNHKALKRFEILKHHKKDGGRGGVSSGIEDSEVRVSDLEPIVRLYGQFLALVKQGPSKQSKEDEEKQNYYVNLGYAIWTLREEFPHLFYRELNFNIYRNPEEIPWGEARHAATSVVFRRRNPTYSKLLIRRAITGLRGL